MSDEITRGTAPTPWHVTTEDIALISRGANILGSGGGGDTYVGQLLATDIVRGAGGVTIIPPDALDDGALVIAVAQVGAETVFAERLARGQEVERAVSTMERYLGQQAAAVLCYEIGGINSMMPVLVAAQRGLPIVDADIMGRAFPELQMTTLDMYGAPPAPLTLCDERGNVTIIAATEDMFWTERLGRALTLAMGGLAYVARPAPRARDLNHLVVGGSYSRAWAIGAALTRAQEEGVPEEIALVSQGGRLILRGMITMIERHATGSKRRIATIQTLDGTTSSISSLDFQNEYLIVRQGAETLATVPDIICVIDEETGAVVNTEALHAGLRIIVVALPADRKLTTPAALRLVGPMGFGYDIPYHASFAQSGHVGEVD
ncbi:MAG: DUF917 domain-containing protein [Chloroflexota bacterium]|nr:DUF917 domain-containing protein [Chloroflexota bacterium]